MKRYKNLLPVLAGAAFLAACDGPLDVEPTASIPFEESLDTPEEIAAAVNGMYDALQADGTYARNLLVFPDMYADNLDFSGTFSTDREVWIRSVQPTNGSVAGIWGAAFDGIGRANNVLAAVDSVDALDEDEATQYAGEALFLRGLNYHNLARFFGRAPIVTAPTWEITPDVNVEASSRAQIMDRVIADLERAEELLGQVASPRAGRANVWAARALLARVYLDVGRYEDARDMATAVIDEGGYELVDNYRNLFEIENSTESIFEVQFTITDPNSLSFWYYPADGGGRYGFNPTEDVLNAYEDAERFFGSVDFSDYEGWYYVDKFFRIETGDDNVSVLRLAEMFLIRAEANWRLGASAADVRADINEVRARVGLDPLDADVDTPDELGLAILAERRVEFAFEGHRLFDLRRILGDAATAAYLDIEPFRLVFPIPQRELDANPALTQNSGY